MRRVRIAIAVAATAVALVVPAVAATAVPAPANSHPTARVGTVHAAPARTGAVRANSRAGGVQPHLLTNAFNGIDATSCTCAPLSPSAAVGPSDIVEAAGFSVSVYSKAGVLLSSTTLDSLFGTTDFLLNSRLVYDPDFDRWVLATTDVSRSAGVQPSVLIAASATSDPTGSWHTYRLMFTGAMFPSGGYITSASLGMDQDGLVITSTALGANSGYLGTAVFSVAKATVYNGLTTVTSPALQVEQDAVPAIVGGYPTQQDSQLYLLAPKDSTDMMDLYYVTNTSHPQSLKLVFKGGIAYTFSAPSRGVHQPGTTATLDAGSGALSSAPSQLDGRVWFAQGVDLAGFPSVAWGYVVPRTMTIKVAQAYHSLSSDDFQPAIVAMDSSGSGPIEILNWAYTDTQNTTGATDVFTVKVGVTLPTKNVPGTPYSSGGGVTTQTQQFALTSSTAAEDDAVGACGPGTTALVANTYFATDGSMRTRLARVGPSC